MIRQIIKKIFPNKIIDLGIRSFVFIWSQYYKLKFRPLIIRSNTTDASVFCQIFVMKDYNFSVSPTPKFIIDGGAYVGYSALYFLSKYPNATIAAVEPEKANFRILKEHTENLNNVICFNAGLWHKDAYLKVRDRGYGQWGFMTEEVRESDRHDIKAITIGTILEETGFDTIDILKLDIEGAEKELFSENTDWLDKVNILIIELHDRMKEGCSKSFYSAIGKYEWNESRRGENLIFVKK